MSLNNERQRERSSEEPAEKRQRTEKHDHDATHNGNLSLEIEAGMNDEVKCTKASSNTQQVVGALKKIAGHIGNPKKFKKASSLLRRLFQQGVLSIENGEECFKVVVSAMRDPKHSGESSLRRDYWKLMSTVCENCSIFTESQKNQLEVYQIWAVLRNQMHTDDNFAFNKVLKKIKELVEALPDATDGDNATYIKWKENMKGDEKDVGGDSEGVEKSEKNEENAAEVDPFDLDALLDTGVEKRDSLWTAEECVCARREALLDCIEVAQDKYRFAWACTSVDMLINVAYENRTKFCSDQQAQIVEFWNFVRQQKSIRRMGPSAVEVRRDTTAFEKAQQEWSQASVSHRGKVGGGGDHKTEMWLG